MILFFKLVTVMLINYKLSISIGLILLNYMACTSTAKPLEHHESFLTQTINCPEGWSCSLEIEKNKSAKIEFDKFNRSYLSIEESKSTLLKFNYTRNPIPGTADSGYDEEIYLNLDKIPTNIYLEDESLNEVNAIFGRMCFCTKESTGYFPIRTGTLKIQKIKKNRFKIDFSFKLETVPQVVEKISEILQF